MNWTNVLQPWQWLVLGSVPPAIVLLYFLKLKRRPVVVPSTYLWMRTIEDLHVNSIWQRLRRSLLLFLQLLLIALIIAALFNPWRRGAATAGQRVVYLIDTSASMQASDVEPTRFEKARRELARRIRRTMGSGDRAMLIQFSNQARVVQNYTGDKALLLRRVAELRPTNRPTSMREALQVAAGLANPSFSREADREVEQDAVPAAVWIYSDGGAPAVLDFDVGNLRLVHVPVGVDEPDNVGITAFSADRNDEHAGQLDLFARVENFGPREVVVELGLRFGDTIEEAADSGRPYLDVKEVRVPPGEAVGEGFRLRDVREGVMVLELLRPDALMLDNRAFLAINRPTRAKVLLVTPGNGPVETALQTSEAQRLANIEKASPDILSSKDYLDAVAVGAYDLVIYDRCTPPEMPLANTVFLSSVPPGKRWSLGEAQSLPSVIDVDRSHPLMQFVAFDDVLAFLEAQRVTGPEGRRTLVEATIGPVVVVAPREGLEDLVVGLPVYRTGDDGEIVPNTDWPRRQSFPVFWINVLKYLGRVQQYATAPTVAPGEVVRIRSPEPVDRLIIEAPDGTRHTVSRSGENVFVFAATEQVGCYRVRHAESDAVVRRFTVNLFRASESDLRAKPLAIGAETVEVSDAAGVGRIEYWKWIVWSALVLLLVEWYVYNKRVVV